MAGSRNIPTRCRRNSPCLHLPTYHGGGYVLHIGSWRFWTFKESPSLTVAMSPLCSAFVTSMRNKDTESATYTAGQLFYRYTRAALLQEISSLIILTNSYGFFMEAVFRSFKLGMVIISGDIAPGSIRSTKFSVLHFLHFLNSKGNLSLLPATGWSELREYLYFIYSIKRSLTYVLGDKDPFTFMSRSLD